MLRILVLVATLMHVPAWGAGLQAITNAEAAGGLRMAFIEGSGAAVAQLGVETPIAHPANRLEILTEPRAAT